MTSTATFCVLYRFRLRPGMEEQFKQGWSRLTEAIRQGRGGLGSRLHLAGDGLWVAYAQWPDRATWERSQQMPQSADPEAGERMAEAIEERFEPLLLEPQIDLLQACPAQPARQQDASG